MLRLLAEREVDRRHSVRFQVEPAYSSVRVREIGALMTPRDGHVYDLSMRGMRFELDDDAFPCGTELEIEIRLPGLCGAIHLKARVVRAASDERAYGPCSVAVEFGRDARGAIARKSLLRLFAQRWLQLAA